MNDKIRLRVGYANLPLFKNAGVAVVYVPKDVASKLVALISEAKILLLPFAPQVAANLTCEAS